MPDDILKEDLEAFEQAEVYEADNRRESVEDKKFALRAENQWPTAIREAREREGRPYLTVNQLPSFIRQVTNDARQNKPAIKARPVDSNADVHTAKVLDGLIRNIEYLSHASAAYQTGIEAAVAGGFGYWTIDIDYAAEDTFDTDICIKRVMNEYSIYGDPNSVEVDSSDWDSAFQIDDMAEDVFERTYKGAEKADWKADPQYDTMPAGWRNEGSRTIRVAHRWFREEYDRTLILLVPPSASDLSMGIAVFEDDIPEDLQAMMEAGLLEVATSRVSKCKRVKKRVLTGAEVLEEIDWKGRYIPIVPVYGAEVNIEGKRYFHSLVRDAKDVQRDLNFWSSAATEMVALAPRAPWLVEEGSIVDPEKWTAANSENVAYLEYSAQAQRPPQRMPIDPGPAVGAMTEARARRDDLKAVIGLYDASLGQKSNETSGKAIIARQREGDVSTFHFHDNQSRAIAHTGRIIIDLIPKVYSKRRMIRVLGEDGKEDAVPLNVPVPVRNASGKPAMDERGQAMTRVYSLDTGKYDVTITTGPSFTTRREEAATQITEMIRAFPAAAPVLGPVLAKNLDWPSADEIAEKLEALAPKPQGGGIPPELQQKIQEGMQRIQQLEQENQGLKSDASLDKMRLQVEAMKAQTEQFSAQTERMKVEGELKIAAVEALKPEPVMEPVG